VARPQALVDSPIVACGDGQESEAEMAMVIEGTIGVTGIGLAGGVLAEILHWWNLREDKQLPDYAKSPKYWIITLAMILAGAFVTWIYFGNSAEAIVALHVGISTPLILQKLAVSVPEIGGSRSIIATPQPSIRRFFSW
jgi:hypothetical protein